MHSTCTGLDCSHAPVVMSAVTGCLSILVTVRGCVHATIFSALQPFSFWAHVLISLAEPAFCVQALEEHIHRQAMATIRLVDERNAMLGISAPYEPQPPTFHSDRTDVPMHAPYPNPKSNAETRARNLLPPSSRSAKNKDHQGRAPTTYSSAGKKSQESYRKGVAGVDLGQHGEHDDAMALQQSELNPPLKTWGSTGKRQPSRPRQKA